MFRFSRFSSTSDPPAHSEFERGEEVDMSAGRICSRVVVTASSNESIRVAAQRMAEKDVGTLVVVDPSRVPEAVGIITDRDLAKFKT